MFNTHLSVASVSFGIICLANFFVVHSFVVHTMFRWFLYYLVIPFGIFLSIFHLNKQCKKKFIFTMFNIMDHMILVSFFRSFSVKHFFWIPSLFLRNENRKKQNKKNKKTIVWAHHLEKNNFQPDFLLYEMICRECGLYALIKYSPFIFVLRGLWF